MFETLRFPYEKGRPILDLSNLRFAAGAGAGTEGKVNAVVGANGAGKTTLLHCMAGLKKKAPGGDGAVPGKRTFLKSIWSKSIPGDAGRETSAFYGECPGGSEHQHAAGASNWEVQTFGRSLRSIITVRSLTFLRIISC